LSARARGTKDPALALKGTGLVFVGSHGADIRGPSRRGAGVYAWDTRHLSRYEVRPRSGRLRLLSAEVLPDGARLRYELRRRAAAPQLLIERRIRVDSAISDEWRLDNPGRRATAFDADLTVDADFRDLFEVRHAKRVTKGRRHVPTADVRSLRFAYTATDGVQHETEIAAPVAAWGIAAGPAYGRLRQAVGPGAHASFRIDIAVRSTLDSPGFEKRDYEAWQETSTHFASDSPALDAWLARSTFDLFLLSDRTADGYFPAGGIPWFVAPFGRDSILVALVSLVLRRDLAPAVLRLLSDYQGRADVPQRDEEPGRIPHEIRQGEIVRTGGAFGTPYYGSVDATPLFVWLAAEAARWLPGRDLITEFEPNLRAALVWMAERGDLDGDGFIEFQKRAPAGIDNQVWKDSGDSLLDPRGRKVPPPIAAVEVQAYAYAALRSLAEVVARRDPAWSTALSARADRLRPRFERAFWMPERGFYAQALDSKKRQIRDIVSNPGHVLWAGAASPAHGRVAARRLRQPDLASGWGIRTRSTRSARYDPRSYQNGAVWPQDTAIAAAGMARYGDREGAARTIGEMLDAAAAFPDYRLPELYGGDPRRRGEPPVPYPVACSPQAWSAAAAFLCVRTMLGLEVAPDGSSVTFDPLLPEGVNRFEAKGLRVGRGTIDVRIARVHGRVRVSDVQASGVRATAG
jgi:glycogen debranching enzyme